MKHVSVYLSVLVNGNSTRTWALVAGGGAEGDGGWCRRAWGLVGEPWPTGAG